MRWLRVPYAHPRVQALYAERSFDRTVIFRETSFEPKPGMTFIIPCVRKPTCIRAKYQEEAAREHTKVVFGGRLGAYAYFDMDDSIGTALDKYDELKRKLTFSADA